MNFDTGKLNFRKRMAREARLHRACEARPRLNWWEKSVKRPGTPNPKADLGFLAVLNC